MDDKHYQAYWRIFAILALLQLPLLNAYPDKEETIEVINSQPEKYTEIGLSAELLHQFNLESWYLIVLTLVLQASTSVSAFYLRRLFILCLGVSIALYLGSHNYQHIAGAPESIAMSYYLYDSGRISTFPVSLTYDALVNYVRVPIAYFITLTSYVWFLTRRATWTTPPPVR